MTAWETLKAEITKGTELDSCGRHVKLIHAAEMFVKLLPFFENNRDEKDAFDADTEVREALINRTELRGIGLLV